MAINYKPEPGKPPHGGAAAWEAIALVVMAKIENPTCSIFLMGD
jgi:hypothetical protein